VLKDKDETSKNEKKKAIELEEDIECENLKCVIGCS
jgi:hypothetical protein